MLEETIFPSSLDNLLILLLTQHPAEIAICICTGTDPQTGFSNFIQITGCQTLQSCSSCIEGQNQPDLKGFLHTRFYTILHNFAKSNNSLPQYIPQFLMKVFFLQFLKTKDTGLITKYLFNGHDSCMENNEKIKSS